MYKKIVNVLAGMYNRVIDYWPCGAQTKLSYRCVCARVVQKIIK